MKLIGCLATGFVLLAGCTAQPVALERTQQALRDAGPSPSDDAVVALAAGEMLCTGFFVSPNVIVTAWHCVAKKLRAGCGPYWTALLEPNDVMVVTGQSPNPNTTKPLAVARVVGREGASDVCGFDVAALVLEAPADVEPLVPRFDRAPEIDEPLQLVGYGLDPDDDSAIGTRRRLEGARVTELGAGAPEGTTGLFDGEFRVDFGPCGGDSGGPAMDAEGRVIGVMSRGLQNVCVDMTYERIDTQRDWLEQVVREAADEGGLDLPSWVSEKPRPTADVDAGSEAQDASSDDVAESSESSGCAVHTNGSARAPAFGLALVAGALSLRRRRLPGRRR